MLLALAAVIIIVAYSSKADDSINNNSIAKQESVQQKPAAKVQKNANSTSSKQENNKKKASIKPSAHAGVEIPAALSDRPEQIIKHVGHTVSFNSKHNNPNWSAWELTEAKTDGPNERSGKFWADPAVSKLNRVEWYEYQGSGYDRGHMCPAADMKWSADAMHDCFYMTNMCPQDHSLNSGSWKKLEDACRRWAISEKCIYIVCGPVYKKGVKHEKIGTDHAITVPEGFFKVILSLRKGKEKAIGFYYANNDLRQSMSKAARSVDEIEKLTNIDFFPKLDDSLETRIEAEHSLSDWK